MRPDDPSTTCTGAIPPARAATLGARHGQLAFDAAVARIERHHIVGWYRRGDRDPSFARRCRFVQHDSYRYVSRRRSIADRDIETIVRGYAAEYVQPEPPSSQRCTLVVEQIGSDLSSRTRQYCGARTPRRYRRSQRACCRQIAERRYTAKPRAARRRFPPHRETRMPGRAPPARERRYRRRTAQSTRRWQSGPASTI